MEKLSFESALTRIINTFGRNILIENRLINILLDFQSFNDYPGIKTILRFMITDGYCSKILDFDESDKNIKMNSLKQDLSRDGGFEYKLVNYVCNCISYALGWENNITELNKNPKDYTIIKSDSRPLNSPSIEGKNYVQHICTQVPHFMRTQYVVFKVKPQDACILFDGKIQTVENGIMAIETSVGTHNYEIRCDKCITEKGSVFVTETSKFIKEIELKRAKLYSTVLLKSSTEDASIYINGIYYGTNKWKGNLLPGTYEVQWTKEGFSNRKKKIIIRADKEYDFVLPNLQPTYGALKLNIKPYGSDIFLDKRKIGETPLLLNEISTGKHEISIINNGTIHFNDVIIVQENSLIEIKK